MAVTGDRPCFSFSPVGAARSQEVLVGVKLHHVDRPRVARELGHHLASSQIPELGGARGRSGLGRALRLPTLPRLRPELFIHMPTTFHSGQAWDMQPQSGGSRGPNPSVIGRRQSSVWAQVRPGATFTVWSSAADANHFPSGLNRRHRTAWLCP